MILKNSVIITLSVLLTTWIVPSSVSSQTFHCVTLLGTQFFTDNPKNLPSGCPIDAQKNREPKGGLSVVDTPDAFPPGPPVDLVAEFDAQLERVTAYKQQAQLLVTRYNDARGDLVFSRRTHERVKAREEIRSIKQQRDALIAQSQSESIGLREREEIRRLLTDIPS